MLRDARAVGRHLVRRELFLRRLHAGVGRRERALRAVELGLHVLQLLLRDGAARDQRRAALVVVLSADQRGAGLDGVGLARHHVGRQRAVVGVHGPHFAHRLRELRFGLIERDPGVARIEHDEVLSLPDDIGVVGVDGDDRAGDLRRDLDDVAGDVGVVGRLEVAADEEVPDAVADAGEDDPARDHQQQAVPAARVRARRLRRRRGRRGSRRSGHLRGRAGRRDGHRGPWRLDGIGIAHAVSWFGSFAHQRAASGDDGTSPR